MSPEAYSWEVIEAAEELYILDGLTFDQVAERTGVSSTQLKRWSAESKPDWPDRRREYRQAQVSVRRGVMLAKARLIESVIETEDPQKAYAFGSLVNSAKVVDQEARERAAMQQSAPVISGAGEQVAHPSDPIEALREAVRMRTASLLQSPGSLTLNAVRDLLQAMELLEKRAGKKAEAEGAGTKTMTPEQLQEEIRKVYGI